MGKLVSESAREREARKYATVFCNITERPEPAKREAVVSSADSILTALAQLGASRLGAARCLISIFDQKTQYIITEATASSTLKPNVNRPDDLWLGCTALPRSHGICDHLLTDDFAELADDSKPSSTKASSPLPVSVIPNLTEHARYRDHGYISSQPHHRFYAGVPLRTSRGIHIGTYSVFDDKPRDSLDSSQIDFMREMSSTIMTHLELRRAAETCSRSERMVRGIGSFVEGKSTMSNLWRGKNEAAFEQLGAEGNLNSNQQTLQHADADRDMAVSGGAQQASRISFIGANTSPDGNQELAEAAVHGGEGEDSVPSDPRASASVDGASRSVTDRTTVTKLTHHSAMSVTSGVGRTFADEVQRAEFRTAYGRAANIIRESIQVEGVAFLDAMVDTFGSLVPGGVDSTSSDSQPDTSGSEGRGSGQQQSDKEEPEQSYCRIFGYSTSYASSIDGKSGSNPRIDVPQKFLRTLLRRYPAGKTFTFGDNGEVVSGDSEEDRSHVSDTSASDAQASLHERKRPVTQSRQSEGEILAAILVGARSVAMVPLWDPIREKWHAGAFIWTKTPDRIFSLESEVSYLRAFGATIMGEINRIEATQAEKMKSDLLGSLSHELRSPLHGMLAGIELMQDTEIDAFQGDALHSMESCGRTLLDVIEHLLDFSKLNRFVKSMKEQKKTRNRGRGRGHSKQQQEAFESRMGPLKTDVDLSVLIEETIESVYAGFAYEHSRVNQADQEITPGSLLSQDSYTYQNSQDPARFTSGSVTVHLDIDANEKWTHHFQPGGLRRIIMNIVGNSLKYTGHGYIVVKMRQVRVPVKHRRYRRNLVLTITDSGKGIATNFLRDRIFTPFSQEDDLQPGTGLGLSLVHQIIRLLDGNITVESELGRGTSIEVTLPLAPAESKVDHPSSLEPDATSLKGLRVGLQGFKETSDVSSLANHTAPNERQILASMCKSWLQLEIVPENSADTRPDCIICKDVALDEVIRDSSGLLPPVVVLCQTGAVARRLLQTHKNANRNDLLEFILQPIGPHKLSKALMLVMARWKDFTTSLIPSTDALGTLKHDFPREEPSGSSNNREPNPSDEPSTLPLQPKPEAMTEQAIERFNEAAVTQPKSTTQTNAARDEAQSGYANSEESLRFLIVDDNKINLQILSAYMKKMGLPYKSAQDGLEALETYATTPGHFCCVLMDISMPVMDGLEATRRIREFEKTRHLSKSLIIALTGMASAKIQQEAFGSGVDLFLPKPVRLKQLTEILKERGLSLV